MAGAGPGSIRKEPSKTGCLVPLLSARKATLSVAAGRAIGRCGLSWIRGLFIFAPLTACGPSVGSSTPDYPAAGSSAPMSVAQVEGYNHAQADVAQAARRVKASLMARASLADAAGSDPGRCEALARAGARVDLYWLALAGAYGALSRTAPTPALLRGAERGEERTHGQRRLDREYHQAWQAFCAGAPPFVLMEPLSGAPTEPLCDGLRVEGEVGFLTRAVRFDVPRSGLGLARWLSVRLADRWDVLIIVAADGLPSQVGERASVTIDRQRRGEGRPPVVGAERLPRWHRLRGVVVVDGAGPLEQAPLLRGLARLHGNRLQLPGCSPQLSGAGWGWSDVGGQLGGGAPDGVEQLSGGRLRFTGLGGQLGLVGNGGNAVPYAPLELYLMGLEHPEHLPQMVFAKHPRDPRGATVQADGVCRLDGQILVQRFGRRPLDRTPWRVGLVVVSAAPLGPARRLELRQDWARFTRQGADDRVDSLNFYEATGGRGQLRPVAPGALVGHCVAEEPVEN